MHLCSSESKPLHILVVMCLCGDISPPVWHGQLTEGVCVHAALIKVCLAYEHGVLPANLHYTKPNPNNESLNAGVLKVRRADCVLRQQYA